MEESKIKKVQYINKLILLFFPVLFGLGNLFAQQNTNAARGEATGTGGSATYSIGQVDYITATGAGGIVTQGLQQPYEILIISGIGETDININLTLSVYPNPTTDFVILSVQNSNTQNMTYMLYDLQGKLIEKQKLSGSQTSIPMNDLADDIYFIKVLNKNTEVKIFKVIKNK